MGLTIIGLGVNAGDISLNAFNHLKQAKTIVLRTENTLSASTLKSWGISYIALDYVYQKSKNFDSLTKNICKEVNALLKQGDVCYLVDGAVSEDTCAEKLLKRNKNAVVFEGVSKAGAMVSRCGLTGKGYTSVSAYQLDSFEKFSLPLVVYDLDSQILASEWKLKLASLIGEEVKVGLYVDKRLKYVSLYEIDGFDYYDYSTTLVIPEIELKKRERFDFNDLVKIVEILRGDNGCPWDRVLTRESLKKTLIEESYELVDAINKGDEEKICEETGDLLLQGAFYIVLSKEQGFYDGSDVLSGICNKLIMRHSHVFGDDKAKSADEALTIWNKNKQVEKNLENPSQYVGDVPKNLPSLLRAEKTLKRIKGFDASLNDKALLIDKIKGVLSKVDGDNKGFELEYKKLLVYVVNLLSVDGFCAEDLAYNATDDLIEFFKQVNLVKTNEQSVDKKAKMNEF